LLIEEPLTSNVEVVSAGGVIVRDTVDVELSPALVTFAVNDTGDVNVELSTVLLSTLSTPAELNCKPVGRPMADHE
jgi:hypothetical protein